jgi:hypothetical protein
MSAGAQVKLTTAPTELNRRPARFTLETVNELRFQQSYRHVHITSLEEPSTRRSSAFAPGFDGRFRRLQPTKKEHLLFSLLFPE